MNGRASKACREFIRKFSPGSKKGYALKKREYTKADQYQKATFLAIMNRIRESRIKNQGISEHVY